MTSSPLSVIFRRDRRAPHEVFAFFPYEASTVGRPEFCTIYQHVGQHSAGDPRAMVRQSRPARPAEYRDLMRELRRIGYKRLRVFRRVPSNAYSVRRLLNRLRVLPYPKIKSASNT